MIVCTYAFPNGYDARYPIVIDPVVEFCTYAGSSADNFGTTATYDAARSLVRCGHCVQYRLPGHHGCAFKPTFGGPTLSGTDMGCHQVQSGWYLLDLEHLSGGSANEVPHSMVTNSR